VGKYETAYLSAADDSPDIPSDGNNVLTFDEALSAARKWARERAADTESDARVSAAPTVQEAIDAYILERKGRPGNAGRDAELRLSHHVLRSQLGKKKLLEVSEVDLMDWRRTLARGGRGKRANGEALAPSTTARLLNDLRAALNVGARKAKATPEFYAILRDGLRAPSKPDRVRTKQVLTDTEVRRLVEAARFIDEDLGDLVLVMAATGARMDQIARISVSEFQPESERVMVPVSHKGKGEKQITHIAVPLPKDVVERLLRVARGRPGHETLLLRWHHRQVAGNSNVGLAPRWERVERRPWANAAALARPWDRILSRACLSSDLVPYCLRHSSIVRGLRAGLPVSLVAAVHDTSAAMIEKHYGAFIVDASEDLLRRAMVSMSG
jgi:integrase